MQQYEGIDTNAAIRHHQGVDRVKVKRVRVIWLVTMAIGGIAVMVFINDTSRAYNDILESMKRYAEDNPNVVVEREAQPIDAQESNATTLQIEVTRDSGADLTAIAPLTD